MAAIAAVPIPEIRAKSCEQPVCVVLEQKLDNGAEIMTDYHNLCVRARILRPPEGDLVIYKQGCVYFPADVLSNSGMDCNFVLLRPFVKAVDTFYTR